MKPDKDLKDDKPNQKTTSADTSNEVKPQSTRRRFTADYKRRILAEVDACERGQIGLLLRREGLYASHIETWRKQDKEGFAKKRGRKATSLHDFRLKYERLARDHARLQKRLLQAETIIEVQKKISTMLGLSVNEEQS